MRSPKVRGSSGFDKLPVLKLDNLRRYEESQIEYSDIELNVPLGEKKRLRNAAVLSAYQKGGEKTESRVRCWLCQVLIEKVSLEQEVEGCYSLTVCHEAG